MHPLVSSSWLKERLEDPALVILDATLPPVGVKPPPDVRARYEEAHLPGAVYFDIEEFSDHATPLPHMLPGEEEFARKASALGVGDQSTLVIYEQAGVFSAPRAWWMFRVMGAERVYLLDGGLEGWIDAGFPVEAGVARKPQREFTARLDAGAVKNFEAIQHLLGGQGQILDARSAMRFSGAAPEPRPGLSSGHMPGAVNLPFTELVEGGRLKSPDQLREIFEEKGIDLGRPVTTTCGSGVTAAVLALGLEIAGANDVTLYDGSWAEYGQRPEAVIEKTAS
jgi:thiosulfate/3-mercaptopyruvate sulfurtransferase